MTHNGKNEKEQSTLSKAVALMEQYEKDGVNKAAGANLKERPDSMNDFLNYLDELGITYRADVLNEPRYQSPSSSELNRIFRELSKKRDNKDS